MIKKYGFKIILFPVELMHYIDNEEIINSDLMFIVKGVNDLITK